VDASFGYVFPAIRGVQARREYYVSMCPLRLIPRIFSFDEEELAPEHRAQRVLNKARIPEMARYILNGRDSYVFSAITASIDAEVTFDPLDPKVSPDVGRLHVPMDARFVINDGQHRRAAIELALREDPALRDESIAVVFFLDLGLARCQQMFADLNRYAIRPSTSLGVLYDHRDPKATLAKRVVFQSPVFADVVEKEKTTLSVRSRKLFTLSSLYAATKALVVGRDGEEVDQVVDLAVTYWNAVASQIPEWQRVREGKMSAGEVRRDFIHSHGVVLQALGMAGSKLLQARANDWRRRLEALSRIDWRRSNDRLWEGRALVGGRVSKATQSVRLTANVIKQALELELSPEEQRLEDAFRRGEHHDA